MAAVDDDQGEAKGLGQLRLFSATAAAQAGQNGNSQHKRKYSFHLFHLSLSKLYFLVAYLNCATMTDLDSMLSRSPAICCSQTS